ncbi:MAG TPA: 8-oxo-dGTP diphosphatase MutT [Verrucomicrobia bacterium]|nr:8-oxo-dGTP diphosphatase MutT [Verrucomicrobiota bacterium]HOP96314.1 8-oxo-dGTP diphosphatase MutT [Verrucomicrobiota bacterium]
MSSDPGPVIEVAAGLVFRNGRLLITRRPAEAHLGGLWEFPGGKREHGESFEECLKRELREELGIDVETAEAVDSITHSYPERTVHLRFFRCIWVRNEPRAIGCPEFRWVTASELDEFAFPAADARLLDRLRATPEWWK